MSSPETLCNVNPLETSEGIKSNPLPVPETMTKPESKPNQQETAESEAEFTFGGTFSVTTENGNGCHMEDLSSLSGRLERLDRHRMRVENELRLWRIQFCIVIFLLVTLFVEAYSVEFREYVLGG